MALHLSGLIKTKNVGSKLISLSHHVLEKRIGEKGENELRFQKIKLWCDPFPIYCS